MPEPIENQITQMAETVAIDTVAATVAESATVETHIDAVSEQLAEHQENSETRHEEILEETSWLGTRLNELTQTANLSQQALQILQTQQTETNRLLLTVQEALLVQKTSATPSEIPQTLPEETPPPSEGAVQSVPVTPQKHKRFRAI